MGRLHCLSFFFLLLRVTKIIIFYPLCFFFVVDETINLTEKRRKKGAKKRESWSIGSNMADGWRFSIVFVSPHLKWSFPSAQMKSEWNLKNEISMKWLDMCPPGLQTISWFIYIKNQFLEIKHRLGFDQSANFLQINLRHFTIESPFWNQIFGKIREPSFRAISISGEIKLILKQKIIICYSFGCNQSICYWFPCWKKEMENKKKDKSMFFFSTPLERVIIYSLRDSADWLLTISWSTFP